jgi:hypothetical protein
VSAISTYVRPRGRSHASTDPLCTGPESVGAYTGSHPGKVIIGVLHVDSILVSWSAVNVLEGQPEVLNLTAADARWRLHGGRLGSDCCHLSGTVAIV